MPRRCAGFKWHWDSDRGYAQLYFYTMASTRSNSLGVATSTSERERTLRPWTLNASGSAMTSIIALEMSIRIAIGVRLSCSERLAVIEDRGYTNGSAYLRPLYSSQATRKPPGQFYEPVTCRLPCCEVGNSCWCVLD